MRGRFEYHSRLRLDWLRLDRLLFNLSFTINHALWQIVNDLAKHTQTTCRILGLSVISGMIDRVHRFLSTVVSPSTTASRSASLSFAMSPTVRTPIASRRSNRAGRTESSPQSDIYHRVVWHCVIPWIESSWLGVDDSSWILVINEKRLRVCQ